MKLTVLGDSLWPPSSRENPPSQDPSSIRESSPLRLVLVFLLFWILAAWLQWAGNAYQAEFGGDPDEPAHYVTGLLLRDYVADLFPVAPMDYARDYYLHYPKVAFGHWPPAFYILQAAWTLPFSPSRHSILLLLAFLSAFLATILYRVLSAGFPRFVGVSVAALMLSLPMLQLHGRSVTAEILHSILVFSSILAFGKYLDKPSAGKSARFGLLAALVILTKPTGIVLALVPPISVLLTRRLELLKRFSFWLPAFVVPAVAGPWYYLVPNAMHQAAVPSEFLLESEGAIGRLRLDWIPVIGGMLFIFALLGLLTRLVRIVRREPIGGAWSAGAALLLGMPVFRMFVTPASFEPRHMLPAVPTLLMFATAGAAWTHQFLDRRLRVNRRWYYAAAFPFSLLFISNVAQMPSKAQYGFRKAAESILAKPEWRDSVLLVSSNALGEGMFIAEVAMHEKRPGHVVLRASKMLATSGWFGEFYRPRHKNAAELMSYIEDLPVGIVVLDQSHDYKARHHDLLRTAIASYPDRWEHWARFGGVGTDGEPTHSIDLFYLVGHEGKEVGPIEIDLGGKLPTKITN